MCCQRDPTPLFPHHCLKVYEVTPSTNVQRAASMAFSALDNSFVALFFTICDVLLRAERTTPIRCCCEASLTGEARELLLHLPNVLRGLVNGGAPVHDRRDPRDGVIFLLNGEGVVRQRLEHAGEDDVQLALLLLRHVGSAAPRPPSTSTHASYRDAAPLWPPTKTRTRTSERGLH